MVNCINLIIEMSPRFILGRENVPCVAEVVNRSLKADCTDYNYKAVYECALLQFSNENLQISVSENYLAGTITQFKISLTQNECF